MGINMQSTNKGRLSFLEDNKGVFKFQGQLDASLTSSQARMFSVKGSTLNSVTESITSNSFTMGFGTSSDDISFFQCSEGTNPQIAYVQVYGFGSGFSTGDKIRLLVCESDIVVDGDVNITWNIVDTIEVTMNTGSNNTFGAFQSQNRPTTNGKCYALAVSGDTSGSTPSGMYLISQMVFGKYNL